MSELSIAWLQTLKNYIYRSIMSRVASTLDNDKYWFTKNKDHAKRSLGPSDLNFMFYKNIYTVV